MAKESYVQTFVFCGRVGTHEAKRKRVIGSYVSTDPHPMSWTRFAVLRYGRTRSLLRPTIIRRPAHFFQLSTL